MFVYRAGDRRHLTNSSSSCIEEEGTVEEIISHHTPWKAVTCLENYVLGNVIIIFFLHNCISMINIPHPQ